MRDDGGRNDRILYLVGEINDELTRELVQQIIESWNRELLLAINSDGGSCYHALGLANLVREHGRIDTLCVGVAESGAADCLAAGRKRYIIPGSTAMIHQVSWELGREFNNNLVASARALDRLNGLLADQLARFTGKTREQLDRDMTTDFYLFDQEIIDYGLADAFWNPGELLPAAPPRRSRLRAAGEHRKRRIPHEDGTDRH